MRIMNRKLIALALTLCLGLPGFANDSNHVLSFSEWKHEKYMVAFKDLNINDYVAVYLKNQNSPEAVKEAVAKLSRQETQALLEGYVRTLKRNQEDSFKSDAPRMRRANLDSHEN